MKQIIHAVHIHATPVAVYAALTTKSGVTGWWTRKAGVEEREGGTIRFTFGGDFHPQMKQTKLEPGRRVEWLCVAGHANWQDNRFTFQIEERKGGGLSAVLAGLCPRAHGRGIRHLQLQLGLYLNSLKQFCEKGAGAPFTPPA